MKAWKDSKGITIFGRYCGGVICTNMGAVCKLHSQKLLKEKASGN